MPDTRTTSPGDPHRASSKNPAEKNPAEDKSQPAADPAPTFVDLDAITDKIQLVGMRLALAEIKARQGRPWSPAELEAITDKYGIEELRKAVLELDAEQDKGTDKA